MATAGECTVGSRVRVAAGDGVVQWTGTNPDFAVGKWVGVQLQVKILDDDGQSVDGSVGTQSASRVVAGGPNTSRPQSSLSQRAKPTSKITGVPPTSARRMSPAPVVSTALARQYADLGTVEAGTNNAFLNRISRTASASDRPPPLAPIVSRNAGAVTSSSSVLLPSQEHDDSSTTSSFDETPTPAPRNAGKDGVFKKPTGLTSRIHANSSAASQSIIDNQLQQQQRQLQTNKPSAQPVSSASVHVEDQEVSRNQPISSLSRSSSRLSNLGGTLNSNQDKREEAHQGRPREMARGTIQAYSRGQPQNEMIVKDAQKDRPESKQQGRENVKIGAAGDDRPDQDSMSKSRASNRELEETKIRLKLLENRRLEDAERIMGLESRVMEAETKAQNFDKLRTKFIEVQQENANLKRGKRELESIRSTFENKESELLEQLELATLDREVAEEKAETLMSELDDMKELVETLKIEVEVLKEENAAYNNPAEPGEERSSMAFVQLEKRNERLGEALLKLQTENKAQQSRLLELERHGDALEALQLRLANSQVELEDAQLHIDDLKQQLDSALGAEEMLEQLTERTLSMGEKIEEMRIHIEDLEALKGLAEELEDNHVENERQLEEQVTFLANQLDEEARKMQDILDEMGDKDDTITQFRDLVAKLQDENHELHEQLHMRSVDKVEGASQSRAVMNLNLKLQSSATKNQARAIDLALSKIALDQAKGHAEILQSYLPETYFERDAAATEALLFLQRLADKARLLINTFCLKHNLPDALQHVKDDRLVGICELRGSLSEFMNLTRRFAGIMRRSTPEEYLNLAPVRFDLSAVERKVDLWIDQLRTNDFVERDCMVELRNFLTQLNHLAETVFIRKELELGERQLGLAAAFDYELDNFAAAVGFTRHIIQSHIDDHDSVIAGSNSTFEEGVYKPVQRILDQVHQVKTSSMHLVQLVDEIQGSDLALNTDEDARLRLLAKSVVQATDIAVQHISELRETKGAIELPVISGFLQELTANVPMDSDIQPWDVIGMFVTRFSNDVNAILPEVQQTVADGHLVTVPSQAPWLGRVAAIRQASNNSVDAEAKLLQKAEEVASLVKEIKLRDQTIQDTRVKTEMLQRKVEGGYHQAEAIEELQSSLAQAKEAHGASERQIESLRQQLSKLETENTMLNRSMDRPSKNAIQVLRNENAHLKATSLFKSISQLPVLLHLPPVPALDPTDTSAQSSASSEDDTLSTPLGKLPKTTQMEEKVLWREMASFQSCATIIDVSQVKPGKTWQPMKTLPEIQLYEREKRAKLLRKRAERQIHRMRVLPREYEASRA
ncbi:hypothetical protein QFC19_003953 [Naganishia cerealis]|uniref:Uncharacterized protein n=1 Tax=Naganishia cerealis TaxID=610337 RepID=A0ACC2VYX7_9TREE|nr:hypothetical protein QFC19_003953 [Naganishia cerealis]